MYETRPIYREREPDKQRRVFEQKRDLPTNGGSKPWTELPIIKELAYFWPPEP